MTTNVVTVYINDIEVKVLENSTILQACEKIGVKVPRFCYHEKLSIAGNCRMCLVEIKNAPKLQASCALPVVKDARIYTDSIAVRKAREGIMELLLINHPLDCPICDQGGECDLQDQAMYYGSDHGRFHEYKRATSDKNFGPFIKTIMTRCIHCTRCVRFATEVAGCPELGTIGRGNNMEISTFVRSNEQAIQSVLESELSGNLIDICPVGALTSLPYAFVARPWELKSVISVDISDTYCSDIKLDIRGQGPGSILRVLPAANNSAWISDKTRFSYDGLKRQRLITPFIKLKGTSTLVNKTWDELFEIDSSVNFTSLNEGEPNLKKTLKEASNISLFVGNHVDLETLKVLQSAEKLNKKLNLYFIHNDSNRYMNNSKNQSLLNYFAQFGDEPSAAFDKNFELTSTFINEKDLEKANLCLLVGTNPRLESAVLNATLQKIAKKGTILLFGSNADKLPYPIKHLGHSSSSLINFCNSPKLIERVLKKDTKSENRWVIVGSSVFYRSDSVDILNTLRKFAIDYNFSVKILYQSVSELNGLHTGLNVVDSYDTNTLNNIQNSDVCIYYNLPNYSLNNPLIQASLTTSSKLIKQQRIYIGSHGNNLTNLCDWILPTAAFTEKVSSYVSNSGKLKSTTMATFPPGSAIQDHILFDKLFRV